MKHIKRFLIAIILAATLFINAHKPSDHEHLAESPTERQYEIVPYTNGFNAIYKQANENKRQQAENERKAKRQQALEEAHRLYDIRQAKIAVEQRQRAEAKRLESQKQTEQRHVSRSNDANITQFEVTAYVFDCQGCTGVTSSGYSVTSTKFYNGYRVLAADKSIPFYTKMEVRLSNGTTFYGIVLDRGGAITKGKLDILVGNEEEARKIGRQSAKVRILN